MTTTIQDYREFKNTQMIKKSKLSSDEKMWNDSVALGLRIMKKQILSSNAN